MPVIQALNHPITQEANTPLQTVALAGWRMHVTACYYTFSTHAHSYSIRRHNCSKFTTSGVFGGRLHFLPQTKSKYSFFWGKKVFFFTFHFESSLAVPNCQYALILRVVLWKWNLPTHWRRDFTGEPKCLSHPFPLGESQETDMVPAWVVQNSTALQRPGGKKALNCVIVYYYCVIT